MRRTLGSLLVVVGTVTSGFGCGEKSSSGGPDGPIVDNFENQLAALSCSNGQVAKWNGTDWACSSDIDTDTLADLSCNANEIAKWNGTDWVCSSDIDTDTDILAGLTCNANEIAKWNGSAWICAADQGGAGTDNDTLGDLVSCASGQVAKWDGFAWDCADDIDTTVPNTDTLGAVGSCGNNQVIKWVGAGWACADDIDTTIANTDTLGDVGACTNGQVVKWSGGGWTCGTDTDTTDPNTDALADVGACTDGQVLKWSGSSWGCGTDIDTTIPNTDTLGAMSSCGNGEIAKWNGSSWACALDEPGYLTTIVFSPEDADAAVNGSNLANLLLGLASVPTLVIVEPGVYDIQNYGVTIPDGVTVQGSGRESTIINWSSAAAGLTDAFTGVGNVAIKDLTLIISSGGASNTTLVGIRVSSNDTVMRVSNVSIEVIADSTTTSLTAAMVGTPSQGSRLILDDVEITIDGSAAAASADGFGVRAGAATTARWGKAELNNVTINVDMQSASSDGYGVEANYGADATIKNSAMSLTGAATAFSYGISARASGNLAGSSIIMRDTQVTSLAGSGAGLGKAVYISALAGPVNVYNSQLVGRDGVADNYSSVDQCSFLFNRMQIVGGSYISGSAACTCKATVTVEYPGGVQTMTFEADACP